MLERPLTALHGIDEPLGFVRKALEDELRARGAHLDEDRKGECIGYLCEVLVRLARRFDPQGAAALRAVKELVDARAAPRELWHAQQRYLRVRARLLERGETPLAAGASFAGELAAAGVDVGPPLSFSTWAYGILRKRYTSFLRWSRGDSRYDNDGREQPVADPDLLRESLAAYDEPDFDALVEQLDHDRLSSRARWALQALARPIAEERISIAEAGRRIGKSRREASRDLERLIAELTA